MQWNQKYSKEKMFTLVEEYLTGSISQVDLCNREGLKKGTFKYWYRKYREDKKSKVSKRSPKKTVSTDFIPIAVCAAGVPDCQELELIYPSGVHLRLKMVLDVDGLSALKQLVSCSG